MNTDATSQNQFHCQRSMLLDAFATAEIVVMQLLRRSGTITNGEPFGHKIEKLKQAKPSPQYSKSAKQAVEILLTQLEPLLLVRADIVHAKLAVVCIDGEERACFLNARNAKEIAPSVRLVTFESFRKLAQETTRLAEKLAAI